MVERSDLIMNQDRPVVQESTREEYVEIVWPDDTPTTVIHRDVAMDMFTDVLRIFSGIDLDKLPDGMDPE